MVSVEEAIDLISNYTETLKTEEIAVSKAMGRVLAVSVKSSVNSPSFRQSAMDGYALAYQDYVDQHQVLEVKGESRAGSTEKQLLEPGTAMRIFTGAPVPDNADTVVMQEKTSISGGTLHIDEDLKEGVNVRSVGEEIRQGEEALPEGTKIDAAVVGFLVTLGVEKVVVYRLPKVAIVITGDELVEAGGVLNYGQIYESNSPTLKAALMKAGFDEPAVVKVQDSYEATKHTLAETIDHHDVVICSGGISVGDYDFVSKALEELGTETLFYKIRQKPGKPMFFGRLRSTLVFALPGNPGSMLTCFYMYVLPSLNKLSGAWQSLPKVYVKTSHDIELKGERAHFIKGVIQDNEVRVLKGQSSFMMQSYALANCLIYIESGVNHVPSGKPVLTYLLPK